jgi:uncharacterized GH25 family protein
MRRLILTAIGSSMALSTAALAHTPYVAPVNFAPDRDHVTLEAALAETNYFVPDFPIRGAEFTVIGPAGETAKAKSTELRELAVVEAALPQQGTYRITTGDRPGRRGKWAKVGGKWLVVRNGPVSDDDAGATAIEEAKLPAGAEVMNTQSFIKAETYVTRGKPTAGPLKPTGQGLELVPETHPSEIYAKQPFKFVLMNDGKPASGAAFSVARANDLYADKRFALEGKSGADGKAQAVFDQPGVYVLEVHYPERAEGSPTPVARSAIYSLSFEVTP